ncbi:MAG: hypothetical protein Q3M30_07105 [Candidatus Electrothrix sp. Rat3]|nr:hypothetical protein [Candidatus Electrothrix rattekaaiensis]
MNTTSLIVEVLVGGFVALVWVFLIIIKAYGIDCTELDEFIVKYKDWSSVILFSIMAISYQLGWLMIHLSYLATHSTIIIPIRKIIFGDKHEDYRTIKNKVYCNSSSELMSGIEKDRSVIRLTRTGLLNFIIFSVVLVVYQLWWLSLTSLIISIICFMQLKAVYFSLYKKLNDSHSEINA